jgi:N-acetylmuramoyl-L-alanine amidase
MFVSNLHIKSFLRIILSCFFFLIFIQSQVYSQNKEVTARKGDGIYRLLQRNGLSYADNLNGFIELNKDKLGKDNTLLAGVTYKLPTGENANASSKSTADARMVTYEIFGKNHETFAIESDELRGAIYYLMAGHGGPDPGAVGKHNGRNVYEDEYAYDVSLRLAKNLISKGATVYLITRDKNDGIRDQSYLRADKDEVCYPNLTIPLNQMRRLRQRTEAVNRLYKKNRKAFQRMISLHIDSRSKRENIDIFFYHDKRSKTGKRASQILRNTIEKKYREHQPNRGYTGTVSSRNLYVVRNTWPTAIFIELGNMNHPRDVKRLVIWDNRQAVANWLTLGLVEDYKTNK